jgi:aspartate/methionine/tyrosine aminotransferase
MEVGQPSSNAPNKVIEAAQSALLQDKIGYTNANGILPLRQAIARHYQRKYGLTVSPDSIIVTTGSSAAFLFAFLGCFDARDAVAICGTGYPCYRNILSALDLQFVCIPANQDFKLTAKELKVEIDHRAQNGLSKLKGLILSSPGNPTGAMLSKEELKDLCELCEENGIVFISDEIYHGISYGSQKESTAIEHSNQVLVINSFSKFYSMTGWRLGWMVVPEQYRDSMIRLSQNFYINAPTLSQRAAIQAFDCEEELQKHVQMYAINRKTVLSTLRELGFQSHGISPADGAFYIYVDLAAAPVHHAQIEDSVTICRRVLEEAGLAITPGIDFEDPSSGLGLRRMRFSYSRSIEEVSEGMRRFKAWWIANYA